MTIIWSWRHESLQNSHRLKISIHKFFLWINFFSKSWRNIQSCHTRILFDHGKLFDCLGRKSKNACEWRWNQLARNLSFSFSASGSSASFWAFSEREGKNLTNVYSRQTCFLSHSWPQKARILHCLKSLTCHSKCAIYEIGREEVVFTLCSSVRGRERQEINNWLIYRYAHTARRATCNKSLSLKNAIIMNALQIS